MESQSNDTDEGSVVLDFSGQKLVDIVPLVDARPAVLIYNKNSITHITNLEYCERHLEQLSLAENRLTDMSGVSRLHNLSVLNLANNGIACIEGLKNLVNLTWLNLSGNNIKVMEDLGGVVQLQHLDLSHNCIASVGLLTHLTKLKTLLLHDNQLSTLKTLPRCLPHGLVILSLAQNHLADLTEFACLSCFSRLGQLSLMDNPCVHANHGATNFDYRPYMLNWCENLMVIDGYAVTEQERRQAVWLRVQGKGRCFKTGQHSQLVEYLCVACPFSDDASMAQDSSDSDEDEPPAKEDSPKELPARTRGVNNSVGDNDPPFPAITDARQLVDQAIVQLQQHSDEKQVQVTGGHQVVSPHRTNAWQEGETVEKLTPQIGEKHSPKDMQLEDVTSSDELTSLLEAETRYLPINSEMIMSPLKPLDLGTSPTAIPQESSHTGTHPQDVPERDTSSLSSQPPGGDAQPQHESRYMQYENRPIKPLNQNRRIAANFAFSPKMHAIKPQPSNSRPQPHCSRWSAREPVSTEVTLNSSNDSTSASSTSVTSELRLLKDILQSKRTKRSSVRRSHSAHVHSDATKEQVRSSVSSSLYKSEYSPDKYTSGRRSTRNRTSGGSREYNGEKRRESGSGSSRKGRDDVDGDVSEAETLAATKLQAFWRGFRTRHKDPAVLQLKQELRDRRAEAHIRNLTEELARQRRLYEEEKQLRHLQMDALKYLWQEVQSLQTWKSDVLCSREELLNHKHLAEEVKSGQSTAEAATAVEGQNSQSHQPHNVASVVQQLQQQQQSPQLSVDASQQVSSSLKESELETTCQSLQKQVSQLQEVLTSISNYVFQGGVISADQEDTGGIRLSVDMEDQVYVADTGETPAEPQAGLSRCSISPISPTRSPGPGIPTPPENLRIFQRTATSGVLQWQASVIYGSSGKLSNKPIIGYRVYANGCAKGMVAGTQQKALVEGLSRTNTYRLTVRAVAALGDSADSNVVMVHAESDDDGDSHKSPPPDDDDDDPDTRRGKDPDDSNGGSPPGGDMEPSGGSARGSRRSSRGSNSGSVTHEDGSTCLHGSNGSIDLLECQSSPPRVPLSSTPNSRSQAELACDADSGCWTSPMSSEKHAQVSPVFVLQHKDDLKERHSRVNESPDRLQRHLEAKQKSTTDEQKSALFIEEERIGSTPLLSSSPRIQEALIKRLEVGRDKGMLVEMKMAAKMHKRKTGPEVSLPLKAVRNNTDGDVKPLDKTDVTNYIDSTVSQTDDIKDNGLDVALDTVHSRIPVYNNKRSPSRVADTDITVLNKETVTKEGRVLSKEPASDGGKHVRRKVSVKLQSPSQCKRDGSSDREMDSIDKRRGSVGSRSSSHSRRSSVESVTGVHSTGVDRVPRNDSEDSMSGHDSLQNSPSSRHRKDSSSDSAASSRRGLGQSPQRKHPTGKTGKRDGKLAAEVSPGTTQMMDDSELENVLLAPPSVSSRRRRTSGSPMRHADKMAVSDRLKEDGSIQRSVESRLVDLRHKQMSHHVDQGAGDADMRRPPAVKQSEYSSARCGEGLPTEHSRLPLRRQTSARRSAREPHRRIRTVTAEKKRSCSVGAVDGQPEAGSTAGDRLTQKPPVLKTTSRDVIGSKPTRRRTRSEHSSPARSMDRRQLGSSPKTGSSKDVATPPKTVRTHRRSRSDMSAIPVPAKKHPDSSTTPKDWKPVPPSTPKQAISSPRIRRSSSFSKATRGKGETEGQYTLRQCVSLEMLKAVKSQEAAAAAAAAAAAVAAVSGATKQDIAPLSTTSSDSPTPASRKPASSPSNNPAAVPVEVGSSRARPGSTKVNSPKVTSTSSPRPATDKVTPKERRLNLGTKAADLFAKLQQRLSANKS